ncbi:MAG: hypothetical protein U0136_21510 [Bdellovibrionota bacterium]
MHTRLDIPFRGNTTDSLSYQLLEELRATRAELKELHGKVNRLESKLQAPGMISSTAAEPRKAFLRASLSRSSDGRKPFFLRMNGPIAYEKQLTELRAVIFLVLLLDLQERSEGGPGVANPIDWIMKSYAAVCETSQTDNQLANNVRVGIHRFELFFHDEFQSHVGTYRLSFDAKHVRLSVVDGKGTQVNEALGVDLRTDDPILSALFDQILSSSPLERARKRKAAFVPPGPDGYEKLVLEMFDHPHPFTVTTIYFRVATISYPYTLLDHFRASHNLKRRREIALDGYRTGRFQFNEILSVDTVWDLIRYSDQDKRFKYYPKDVTLALVEDQLNCLVSQVESYPTYNLVLTEAPVPFYLGTCEIYGGNEAEYFTFFPRLSGEDRTRDVSCFVLADPVVTRDTQRNIVDWIIDHPLTQSSRTEVLATLNQVRDHLLSNGPLTLEETPPPSILRVQGNSVR